MAREIDDASRYRLFYDRKESSIEGLLSVVDTVTNSNHPLFSRIQSRSGVNNRSSINSDWIRGRSPIPYGSHWLDLTSPKQINELPSKSNNYIGEFWPIYNERGRINQGDTRTIQGPISNQIRWDIGLHCDNDFIKGLGWKGSLGCVVVALPEKFKQLSIFLHSLKGEKIDFITL